jgi:hypothetical protein
MIRNAINVTSHEIMQNLTLEVRFSGVKAFKVRTWIAVRLVKLAAVIIGCGVKVDLN